MKDKRKAYEEKFHAELEDWNDGLNAQIALLKARADKARPRRRLNTYKTIEALQHYNSHHCQDTKSLE